MKPAKFIRSGFTLVELLLSCALMMMLLLAVYAIAASLERSQVVTNARVEPRQALRLGLNRFAVGASGASYFYQGDPNGATTKVGSFTVNLPYRDSAGNWRTGSSVVLAVPEDYTRPSDSNADPTNPATILIDPKSASAKPDGFPDRDYTILLLTTLERSKPSRTKGARELLIARWDHVTPSLPFQPSKVDLSGLGKPTNMTNYDAFLKPISENGLVISYLVKDDVPTACNILSQFRQVPIKQGPPQEEAYNFVFTTRNS